MRWILFFSSFAHFKVILQMYENVIWFGLIQLKNSTHIAHTQRKWSAKHHHFKMHITNWSADIFQCFYFLFDAVFVVVLFRFSFRTNTHTPRERDEYKRAQIHCIAASLSMNSFSSLCLLADIYSPSNLFEECVTVLLISRQV